MRRRTRWAAVAGLAASLLAGATACTAGPVADPARVDVVAAFYPLQFVAERVGGDQVRVTNLVKPGAEPHDLELTPAQVGAVAGAELVVYLGGFQPAVDAAVRGEAAGRAFDVAAVQPLLGGAGAGGEPGGGPDPHVWLDPTRLATIADRLGDRLALADPAHAAGYRQRASALRAELDRLDREYTGGLASCQRRELVTSHTAFTYLADRYRLTQIGITGVSPEAEPTPQRLAEVARLARQHGATTIFFETLVSPKVATALAAQVGARTAVLDPIEGLPAGSRDDYVTVMRRNLAALASALDCR